MPLKRKNVKPVAVDLILEDETYIEDNISKKACLGCKSSKYRCLYYSTNKPKVWGEVFERKPTEKQMGADLYIEEMQKKHWATRSAEQKKQPPP